VQRQDMLGSRRPWRPGRLLPALVLLLALGAGVLGGDPAPSSATPGTSRSATTAGTSRS
jgi:hypothetical protein